MIRSSRWLALALVFATTAASAGARDALDTFGNNLKGLDGQFEQKVYGADGTLKET